MTWIELVGTFLGGGAFQALINYFISRQKAKGDDFDKIIGTWAADNERLRKQQSSDEQRIRILETEVATLRNQLILLESAHQDLPIPMWLKDTELKMIVLNESYVDVFLTPLGKKSGDYIGKTDFDVWPEEIAKKFIEHDRKVMRTKKTFIGVESVVDGDGQKVPYKIIKYPRYAGKTIIGIAGIAIPIQE